jgi:flagellar hook-length control protein FliK
VSEDSQPANKAGAGSGSGIGTGLSSSTSETKPSEAARELQTLMGDMKVSVARQETHLTPTMPHSPAMQIAHRITGEIYGASATEVTTASAQQNASQDAQRSGSTVKVLQLRLDPPELGMLSVRMSLKQGVLALQVEATRPETASLIERDRDALIGLLRTAGYSVDGLTVQMTPSASNSALGSNYGGNLATTGQQQQFAGQQTGEDRSGQTGQDQHQDQGQPVWGDADENAEMHPARDPGGALYL